jgi:hypothetical protein
MYIAAAESTRVDRQTLSVALAGVPQSVQRSSALSVWRCLVLRRHIDTQNELSDATLHNAYLYDRISRW